MKKATKRLWAKVLGAFALFFGAVLGSWAMVRYRQFNSNHGEVKSPTPFVKDPHRKDRIQVWAGNDKGFKAVQLPEGVVSSQVKAVELVENGLTEVKVEVKNAKVVDRRSVLGG